MKKCVNISLLQWDVMFIHCMCNEPHYIMLVSAACFE